MLIFKIPWKCTSHTKTMIEKKNSHCVIGDLWFKYWCSNLFCFDMFMFLLSCLEMKNSVMGFSDQKRNYIILGEENPPVQIQDKLFIFFNFFFEWSSISIYPVGSNANIAHLNLCSAQLVLKRERNLDDWRIIWSTVMSYMTWSCSIVALSMLVSLECFLGFEQALCSLFVVSGWVWKEKGSFTPRQQWFRLLTPDPVGV